jgi:hypothetical protein
MRYGIHWDIVAAIPLIFGLLLADHLGQGRKSRKAIEQKKLAKEEAKASKEMGETKMLKKRKSGFRRMKSNAQRIRERTRRQEEAAAALAE